MIAQSKDRRKVSGGMRQLHRKKKLYERGSRPTLTKLGDVKLRADRVRSAHHKIRVLVSNIANVYDPKSKKFTKTPIKTVSQNPSNRHYARANIITKGAVLDTELGKVKVTSRPGQDGTINATLIESK
ncbi:30S ribosomal protein S8e [Candidatus Woesearchaeota archaeon]|nr:30S ribosomal protein S8e [Candidatus Woesearchaeota archaeon]